MAGPLTGMYAAMAQGQPAARPATFGPLEEMAYQKWKATLPKGLQYEGDYDLRGFYKQNPDFSVDNPTQHMTDEFKLPNHPTFSDESKFYGPNTAQMGGHWNGDVFTPNTPMKRRVDETPGTLAPDPRNVDRREPESYSDFVRLFGHPPVSRVTPEMPFRDRMQEGPSPPVGRLEMAYRSQK